MYYRINSKIILIGAFGGLLLHSPKGHSQVAERGINPAANTLRSFQDASLNRDSGQFQPLNLLNDFYPSIEIRIEDHDNVRRRPDVEEDDLLITASPSLGYRTNFGRHQFYAAYNGTFTFHQDLTQEDAQENTLNAKLGLDLSRRWDLELFGGIGESFERRGISGSRDFLTFENQGFDSGPENLDFVNYGVDLIFGRKIGLLQAVLGYDYSSSSYSTNDLTDNVNFSDSRDRESDSIHLDLNWQFADRTSVFARVEETDTDYDRLDSTLDNSQTNFLFGLRWKPVNSLSGSIGAGFTDRTFDDPSREGFDGSVYYANLNYDINPFSSLSFNASRTIEEPGDINADFFESELIGLGWTHSLSPRYSIDLYAKAIDDDFNNGREDQFFDWGVELSYNWRRWLTASIYYSEIERESNIEGIAFEDAFIGIRLRSDLRSFLTSGSRGDKELEPRTFGNLKKIESVGK